MPLTTDLSLQAPVNTLLTTVFVTSYRDSRKSTCHIFFILYCFSSFVKLFNHQRQRFWVNSLFTKLHTVSVIAKLIIRVLDILSRVFMVSSIAFRLLAVAAASATSQKSATPYYWEWPMEVGEGPDPERGFSVTSVVWERYIALPNGGVSLIQVWLIQLGGSLTITKRLTL